MQRNSHTIHSYTFSEGESRALWMLMHGLSKVQISNAVMASLGDVDDVDFGEYDDGDSSDIIHKLRLMEDFLGGFFNDTED